MKINVTKTFHSKRARFRIWIQEVRLFASDDRKVHSRTHPAVPSGQLLRCRQFVRQSACCSRSHCRSHCRSLLFLSQQRHSCHPAFTPIIHSVDSTHIPIDISPGIQPTDHSRSSTGGQIFFFVSWMTQSLSWRDCSFSHAVFRSASIRMRSTPSIAAAGCRPAKRGPIGLTSPCESDGELVSYRMEIRFCNRI